MSIRPFANNVLAAAKSVSVQNSGSYLVARTVKVFASGALSQVFSSAPALSASVSGGAYGYSSSSKPATQVVQTNTITVTPSGGYGPYSYSWVPGNARVSVSAPSSASTFFSASLNNEEIDTSPVCTVTDSTGHVTTVTADAQLIQSSSF